MFACQATPSTWLLPQMCRFWPTTSQGASSRRLSRIPVNYTSCFLISDCSVPFVGQSRQLRSMEFNRFCPLSILSRWFDQAPVNVGFSQLFVWTLRFLLELLPGFATWNAGEIRSRPLLQIVRVVQGTLRDFTCFLRSLYCVPAQAHW